MKSIIATLLLALNIAAFAQPDRLNRQHDKHQPELTSEQKKSLRIKNLTLELDLSSSQQKDMALLLDEQMTARKSIKEKMHTVRKSGQKPTSAEVFEHKSQMLDQRIAFNAKAKKILDKNQFEDWKKLQHDSARKMKGGHKKQKHNRSDSE